MATSMTHSTPARASARPSPETTSTPPERDIAAGVVVAPHGRPFSVMGFTVARGRIVAIDALADRPRAPAPLHLAVLDD